MIERFQRHGWMLFALVAALTLVSTLILTVRNFSPVPYWDMWDGYIGFDLRLSRGDLWAWLDQHNEHRIIFSRLLFWLDLHLFGGTTHFLIACNFILAGAAVATLAVIVRQALPGEALLRARWILYAISTTLCFSWMQKENFSWAFQSQFFAAQLFPLLAFFLLWRSTSTQAVWCFPLACLFGLASAGTMANGIAALPCLLVLALLLRVGQARLLILVLLCAFTILAYFHNYHSNPEHGSLSAALRTNPLGLLRYIFLYLGGPLVHLGLPHRLGEVAGMFFFLSSLGFAHINARDWRDRPLALCLIAYLAYLGATAFATAGGRFSIFGLEQALSSRYATPALMGWCTLCILYAQRWAGRLSQSTKLQGIALLLVIGFLPLQIHYLKMKVDDPAWRMLAALSLEMGVRDEYTLPYIFYAYDRLAIYSAEARQQNLSIFANPAIRDVHEAMGQPVKVQGDTTCQGTVDVMPAVQGDASYRQIIGWIYSSKQGQVPKKLWIADADGTIVGYALPGHRRNDVAKAIDSRAKYSGFYGYVKNVPVPGTIKLVAEDPACTLVVQQQ